MALNTRGNTQSLNSLGLCVVILLSCGAFILLCVGPSSRLKLTRFVGDSAHVSVTAQHRLSLNASPRGSTLQPPQQKILAETLLP